MSLAQVNEVGHGCAVLPFWGPLDTTVGGANPITAQEPCRRLDAQDTLTSGLEEVCQKPASRKSWGQLLADYLGYHAYRKSYALVVGISNYTGGYSDLPTENDALKMRDFLFHEAGFDYVHVLTNGRATIDRIRELMIDEFYNRIDDNDRFLFYWSGHGLTRRQSGFLPVSDTPKGQYSKMISMNNIQQWNRYLRAKQSLFLLDACFSGLAGSVPKKLSKDLTLEQLTQRSHHLMTAGTAREETIAGDWWDGSLFTTAVIDGLRGEADTASSFRRDGVVSLRELIVYIQRRVAVEKERVGWKRSLTPQLRDLHSSEGEFFFLTTQGKRETISKRGFEPGHTSEYGEPLVKSPRRVAKPTPDLIKEAQEVLTELGYRPGPVDGKLGIRTRGAILKFQKDAGLPPTGELDSRTIESLTNAWSDQERPNEKDKKPPIITPVVQPVEKDHLKQEKTQKEQNDQVHNDTKHTKSSETQFKIPTIDQTRQPTGRFVYYKNNTALDTKTKLIWMTKDFRNIEGRPPDSWHEAMSWAKKMNDQSYGGHSDWRVPSPEEYRTTYDQRKLQKSYRGKVVGYPEIFEAQGGEMYWSNEKIFRGNMSSESVDQAYVVYFRSQTIILHTLSDTSKQFSVRLVRRGS